MRKGRRGTISPLKPLYWHNCKTKINCSLLPTPLPLMPASACNFLLSAHYEKVILLSHLAGSWNPPNEVRGAEMHAFISQQKPCNIRCCYVSKLYVKRKTGIWAGFIRNTEDDGLIWKDRWRQTLQLLHPNFLLQHQVKWWVTEDNARETSGISHTQAYGLLSAIRVLNTDNFCTCIFVLYPIFSMNHFRITLL